MMSTSSASRRAFRRYWIAEPLDGLWKATLYHAMRFMPIGVASALGGALGRLLGVTVYRGREARARRHYLRVEPQASPAQLDRAMRSMWSNLGRSMAELSAIDRLWRSGRLEVQGAEHLLGAQRAGRPFVMACLHLSNWELTGVGFANLGLEGCGIFSRSGSRFDERLIAAIRRRLTTRHAIYPPGPASARAVYDTVVRRRQGVHIHIDELYKGRAPIPSFGRPLEIRGNIANAVRLALAADAVLILAYAERLGEQARFRLVYEAPFPLERSGDRRADIRVNVERLDAHIAPVIRAHLPQWRQLMYD